METYVLIDFMNLSHRVKNANVHSDIDMKVGLSMQTIFHSIKKSFLNFGATHVAVCTEGNSWRKKAYPKYKKNRVLKKLQRTETEVEEDEIFMDAMGELEEFFREKTNVTVLNHKYSEADDMIAIFIRAHPNDKHVIVSTDSDYYQCLAENVTIYNGVEDHIITLEGFFDMKGKPVKDKTGAIKAAPCPRYSLFEKCIRGDKSDNVMSAYPGVRTKGTKNKVGILEAFADMDTKGYDWNNFMQSKWIDHEDVERTVGDMYELNKSIIDLTQQPEDILEGCLVSMSESLAKERVSKVGINFLRFCGKWNLAMLSKYPEEISSMLQKPYNFES